MDDESDAFCNKYYHSLWEFPKGLGRAWEAKTPEKPMKFVDVLRNSQFTVFFYVV